MNPEQCSSAEQFGPSTSAEAWGLRYPGLVMGKGGKNEVKEFTGMWRLKPDADLVAFTKALAPGGWINPPGESFSVMTTGSLGLPLSGSGASWSGRSDKPGRLEAISDRHGGERRDHLMTGKILEKKCERTLNEMCDRIRQEYKLIDNRMSWMLTSEGFLFAAFTLSIGQNKFKPEDDYSNLLVLVPSLICMIGILISTVCTCGIVAALFANVRWKSFVKEEYRHLLTSEPKVHFFGALPATISGPVLVAIWFVLAKNLGAQGLFFSSNGLILGAGVLVGFAILFTYTFKFFPKTSPGRNA
jgi:hypothetical protein